MTTSERRWVRVTRCENIPVREGRIAEVAGRELAIFNLGERFLAIENRCPHRGGPLADGMVSGQTVVCPLHGWKFDLAAGNTVNHPESELCAICFPTRVEQGIVLVEVPMLSQAEDPAAAKCAHRDRPLRWVHRKAHATSIARIMEA